MNISQAIRQIIDAVRSCTATDANGRRIVPTASQRPLLLYGPPGIGKTAIVHQAADALGIAFLSYTMTHHTRQSALGLPRIVEREYNGARHAVTEYTMSDIIRDVYETAARPGGERGILFLDEINCVSETLMPAMLELLQFKRFGSYALPDGWIIVCAGNPEEYNRSARAFDPVTTDRVRMIKIEPDLQSWLEHAAAHNTHPTILSYLRLRPDHLCVYTAEGSVTPRSWSDLSSAIRAYEAIGITVDPVLFEQFLQCEDICRSFALYFAMCTRSIAAIDIGKIPQGDHDDIKEHVSHSSFDEKVFIATLLGEMLCTRCDGFSAGSNAASRIENFLQGMRGIDPAGFCAEAEKRLQRMEDAYSIRWNAGLIRAGDAKDETAFFAILRAALSTPDPENELNARRISYSSEASAREAELTESMRNVLAFVEQSFADSSLRVVFAAILRSSGSCMAFLRSHPFDSWARISNDTDMRIRGKELRVSLQGGDPQ